MSDSMKRAIRTGVQAFVGVFGVAWAGFAAQVASWAGCDAAVQACAFPDPDPLIKAAVAGAIAAVTGLVSWVQNAIEDATGHALLKEPRGRHAA